MLGGLLLAGLLAGCGAAGATDEEAPETGTSPSAAASPAGESSPDGEAGEKAEEGAGQKAAEKAGKKAGAAVAGLRTPLETLASDLPSAKPVAADAPEVAPIAAALRAHEAFVPSDVPARGNPQAPGQEEPTELDPDAVAAAEESADGSALQEIIASLTEFEHQGWEQRGVPAVVGRPVLAPLTMDDGEAARVTVCLDSSRVTVVDRDGNVIRGPEKDRRALHNYDLVRQPGQSWQVVQHGFPDDPTC